MNNTDKNKEYYESSEFQRGVDSVKKDIHDNRDWCECGKCEPREKNPKMCKNSLWYIYHPYEPQKKQTLGEKIEQKLKELRDLCVFGASNETASVSFFLNSEGWNTEIQKRSADSLKRDGISMRNIKGEWIK